MAIRNRIRIPLQKTDRTEFVTFALHDHTTEDIAILFDGWESQENVLIRLHSECLTGDVFGSERCDCNKQLHEAIDIMVKHGGVIFYLRQEGRNIGLYNKLDAYTLQSQGFDTFQANRHLGFPDDARSYKFAALMLKDLGIHKIRLLSNNPDKGKNLTAHGITVTETIQTSVFENENNTAYLDAKRKKGHLLA